MSRFGGRHSANDLAYGEDSGPPANRWDRERFERARRGPDDRERERERDVRETIHVRERESPRRTEIRIEEREREVPRRGAGRIHDERDFGFMEEERYGPPARIPRRSDRDLFGDFDPRDVDERQQLAPIRRRKSIIERDIEIERGPARPGLLRRQSSLDTFDRRPMRREREEYRLPPNVPIPLPRRASPARSRRGGGGGDYEEFEDIRYTDYSPRGYRDMEIIRERSKSKVRRRDRARSDVHSVSNRSSSTESFEEISRAGSPSPERKVGKKGKTRMPKRLVRKEAIVQLGYPFEEEVRDDQPAHAPLTRILLY